MAASVPAFTVGAGVTVRVMRELASLQVPEPKPVAVRVMVMVPVVLGVNTGFRA